jgi:hypothetical protein
MDLVSSGDRSEFTKLEKYGIPYLPVIFQTISRFWFPQSKSGVIWYVGMGKVNALPLASPSIMTSANALLTISISGWKSEYFSFCRMPPTITCSCFKVVGTCRSMVMLVKGVLKPTRVGILLLKTNSWKACLT